MTLVRDLCVTCSKAPFHIIPAKGDFCKTPVYLLEEAIFSVIPVKLAPYSDTGTGI